MANRWLMIAITLLVTGCGGYTPFGDTEHKTTDVSTLKNLQASTNNTSLSTHLLEVQRLSPKKGSVSEAVPLQIKITALDNLSDVVIRDNYSGHATVLDTTPPAEVSDGQIVWRFGTMEKGESKLLTANLKTEQVGDLVDYVTVSALPRLYASTYIGKCHLCLEKTGPEELSIGDSGYYTITITNDGSSDAKNIVVKDIIPEGLSHSSGGKEILWEIGDLAAGCSETMSVCLEAAQVGRHQSSAIASGSNASEVRSEACTTVYQANIDVSISGTEEQTVGKHADYTITVTNTGDCEVKDILVSDKISRHTTVSDAGAGTVRGNAICWTVDSLAAGESKIWDITLENETPVSCESSLYVKASNKLGAAIENSDSCTTKWLGLPGLFVEMVDTCDPMLIGERSAYHVRVSNQGSTAEKGIQITATFPKELEPQETPNSTKGLIKGQIVTFNEDMVLEPGESIDYIINVKAIDAGDAKVSVALQSHSLRLPVTEEESTYIY